MEPRGCCQEDSYTWCRVHTDWCTDRGGKIAQGRDADLVILSGNRRSGLRTSFQELFARPPSATSSGSCARRTGTAFRSLRSTFSSGVQSMTFSTEQPRMLGWRDSSRESLMQSYSPHFVDRGARQIGRTRMAQLRADHDGILGAFPTSLARSDDERRVAIHLSIFPSELFGRHRTPKGVASESCR